MKLKRYFVCWEARYAYSSTKFDGIFDWNGLDLDSLKKRLKGYTISKCNIKDGEVGITILSLTELSNAE